MPLFGLFGKSKSSGDMDFASQAIHSFFGDHSVSNDLCLALEEAGWTLPKLKALPLVDPDDKDEASDEYDELMDEVKTLMKGIISIKKGDRQTLKKAFSKGMKKLKAYNPELKNKLKKELQKLTNGLVSPKLKELQIQSKKVTQEVSNTLDKVSDLFGAVASGHQEFTGEILPQLRKACQKMTRAFRRTQDWNRNSVKLCIDLQGDDEPKETNDGDDEKDDYGGYLNFMRLALERGSKGDAIDKQISICQQTGSARIQMMINLSAEIIKEWKEVQAILDKQYENITQMKVKIVAKREKARVQKTDTENELTRLKTCLIGLRSEVENRRLQRQEKRAARDAKEAEKTSVGTVLLSIVTVGIYALVKIPQLNAGIKEDDAAIGSFNGQIASSEEGIKVADGLKAKTAATLDNCESSIISCGKVSDNLSNTCSGIDELSSISENQQGELLSMVESYKMLKVTWVELVATIKSAGDDEEVKAVLKQSGMLDNVFRNCNKEVCQIRKQSNLAIENANEFAKKIEMARAKLLGHKTIAEMQKNEGDKLMKEASPPTLAAGPTDG